MKNSKSTAILAIAVAAMVSLTACVSTNNIENVMTAYPATAANITVEQQPLAVASLSPSITKLLIELGYANKIVGYSDSCEAEGVTITDEQRIGTGLKPNMTNIGKLAPELIFTNVPLSKAHMEKLAGVGMKVIVIPVVKDIDTLKRDYVDIINLMEGNIEAFHKGIEQVDELQQSLEHIDSLLKAETKPSFLYITSSDFVIATSDTFESSLLSYVGANAASGEGMTEYNVTPEQLAAMNPDIIFYADGVDPEAIKASELYKEKNAVKNGKLIKVDNKKLTLQNIEADEVVREIAKAVYPAIDFTPPPPVPAPEPVEKKWYEIFS